MRRREIAVSLDEREYSLILDSVSDEMRAFLTRSTVLRGLLARHNAAALVINRTFVSPEDIAWLTGHIRRGVRWPVVQILRKGELAVRDGLACAAAVLTHNEVHTRFVPAVRRALVDWRMADAAERAQQRFVTLRVVYAALMSVFTDDPPSHSVPDISARTGCSVSHIFDKWRDGVSVSAGLELREVINWVLLLRALQFMDSNRSWSAVVRYLGIGLVRLEDHANNLLGQTLGGLENELGMAVLEKFDDTVLARLGLSGAAE